MWVRLLPKLPLSRRGVQAPYCQLLLRTRRTIHARQHRFQRFSDNVLGQDAYFGAKRQEQSENKKHLKRLLKNWEEEQKSVALIFHLLSNMVLKIFHLQSLCTVQPKTSGFPLWKSISSRPRTRRIHFRSGGQKLSSTVGTTTSLRKSIFSFLRFFSLLPHGQEGNPRRKDPKLGQRRC